MGGGKQTPRQKMIGMMYLVLTALLALNVSTEVLRSFLIVNDGIVATNRNFETKVESVYAMFERALAENKEKVQENFDKAMEARRLTAEFRQYVQATRAELISLATGLPVAETVNFDPHDISRQDDYDTPSMFLVEQGKGTEVRQKIIEFESNMMALLPNEEAKSRIVTPFNVTGPFKNASGQDVSWEMANFYKAIIVAAITTFNTLENAAMNLEFDVTNELFKLISAGDMTFDNVVARIVPKSTFVALGENFEAEIFLVAFDSKTRVTANVNGQNLNSVNGIVTFKSPTTKEGVFPVSGYLDVPGGDRYSFKTEYVVAAPSATVAADQMNVFYIGVDNPITVAVSGVDPTSVRTSISGAGGTLTPIAGQAGGYIVRVTSRGDATVTLSAVSGNETKTMAASKFRVKAVPDPIVVANGVDEHATFVDKNVLAGAGGLIARMKDFDFQLNVQVVSFTMTTTVAGDFTEFKSTNNRFTEQMITQIRNARRNQRIYFENIVVQMPTGPQTMRNIGYTIR
jgi:gliding motility-associated protein GldM